MEVPYAANEVRVRCTRCLVMTLVVAFAISLVLWLGMVPSRHSDNQGLAAPMPAARTALRIGVIPEHDIFAQRRRYQAMADYLSTELKRPVELVTVSSYENIIADFADHQIDAAFLGSLTAVLAVDQFQVQLLVKAERSENQSGYSGILFVPESSPIHSIGELSGQTLAVVRTTMAAHLFPTYELKRAGLLGTDRSPRFLWVGTHEDVLSEVASGRASAGAVKNLRMNEWMQRNPSQKLRVLRESSLVPESTFAIRRDLPPDVTNKLRQTLLEMSSAQAGRTTLETFGAVRFVSCEAREFEPIYAMADELAPVWSDLGMPGRAPKRPATLPAP